MDIEGFGSKDRILFDRQTGEDGYLQNYAALEQLEKERNMLTNIAAVGGAIVALPALVSVPVLGSLVAIPGFGVTLLSGEYLARVSRLCITMTMLLDYFGAEGITITPRVKTDFGAIDLFIRMPDKRKFAIMLRSNGESFIRWREERQGFFAYRKGKSSFKEWYPGRHILDNFSLQTNWLIKSQSPLLGVSSTERKKPLVRALVLTGKTKLDRPHLEPSAKQEFGQTRVVKINGKSTMYFLESEDLIKFLLPKSE
jgi:hypothetical protein